MIGAKRRTAAFAAAAMTPVFLYAVLATQLFGLAWPLPRVLANTVTFRGDRFTKEDEVGCKSLTEWSRIQRTPVSAYHPLGHLGSAVYFFRPLIITPLAPDLTYHQFRWFLARSGDCYVYYQNELGG